MSDTAPAQRRSPWLWVPTAYFAEGIPYVVVNSVSVVLYKGMGVPNRLIGLTSVLYLPWVIKMLWGPLVDTRSTKRRWIVGTQLALAAAFALAACAARSPSFFALSIALFALIAFASATHDIAVDGFYMLGLTRPAQALFAGVRSTAYRIAMLFASGGLVVLAGRVGRSAGDPGMGWIAALSAAGAVFASLAVFHAWYLPRPVPDAPRRGAGRGGAPFAAVFRSYAAQPSVGAVLAFILLYRLGEAMLVKMAQPFLLDPPARGGLGLSTEGVGAIYGTAGTCCLLAGGILGGALIARFGLRRCIWPMALALNVPDLGYLYLAWARPPLPWVAGLVAAEQFGYGLGFTGFTVFLMYIAREPYKTAHYAISTGVMALGMMAPGAASGFLQERLGYPAFFALVCALTIPGMASLLFIPDVENAGGKG
jgi:PAT family beta-lactamase induction signal transducer AmpG